MPKALELTGKRIGRLIVLDRVENPRKNGTLWRVRCDCGVERTMLGMTLNSKLTRSCGCVKASVIGDATRTHGARKTRAYYSWWNMRSRCERVGSRYFADYGGRGIGVCARWREFENFLADMGQPGEGQTLERINNDLGYSPENCRWADRKAQANNRRSSVFYEVNGQRKTLQQWADDVGLLRSTISARIKSGWSVDRAILTPKVK